MPKVIERMPDFLIETDAFEEKHWIWSNNHKIERNYAICSAVLHNFQYSSLTQPSIQHRDGFEEWWFNNKLHSIQGPAVRDPEHPITKERKAYFLNGKRLSEYQWKKRKNQIPVAPLIDALLLDYVVYPGRVQYKVKINQKVLFFSWTMNNSFYWTDLNHENHNFDLPNVDVMWKKLSWYEYGELIKTDWAGDI